MARTQNMGRGARENVPDDPTDLSGGSWREAGKRALKEYKDDDLQDRAAALTYFGIQSIFPGLLVLVSLLGLLGKSDAAARGLRWEASLASGDGQGRRSGLEYGPGPDDGGADARADCGGCDAGTEMADNMAAAFDGLREAAAAHDTSELNDIALPS